MDHVSVIPIKTSIPRRCSIPIFDYLRVSRVGYKRFLQDAMYGRVLLSSFFVPKRLQIVTDEDPTLVVITFFTLIRQTQYTPHQMDTPAGLPPKMQESCVIPPTPPPKR